MVTLKFYLDTRRTAEGCAAPLKLAVCLNRVTRYVSTGIRLTAPEWDAKACKASARHYDHRHLNKQLEKIMEEARRAAAAMRPQADIREYAAAVSSVLHPREDRRTPRPDLFMPRLEEFCTSARRKPGTRSVYRQTLSRIRAFDADADQLTFEDIDRRWLERFDEFMARTARSRNARNIHLRNIRAVFNDAIDDEVTACYPFRRFKIRPQATRKRSLSVERLRELFAYPVEPYAVRYVDMFKLIFCLCGINAVDLCNLRRVTEGRIEYERAKTGRQYSIRVEPEAQEIIDRYRGERHLLDILDTSSDHHNFIKHCNKALQRIGVVERRGKGGKKFIEPAFPGLTTYWARHSWATTAASLDIPKETIAAALGHGGNTVTDIYIDFDQRKVDEANRRVLDWVFYGKR
mgnify:FL=1